MILRELAIAFCAQLRDYPVATVLGPRQSGETTLISSTLPDFAYVSLEAPDIRQLAHNDPKAFLRRSSPPAIYDEIQRAPHLLSYFQGQVDEFGKNGQFVLTGSHQLKLRAAIAQSLAGRAESRICNRFRPRNWQKPEYRVSTTHRRCSKASYPASMTSSKGRARLMPITTKRMSILTCAS